MRNATSLLAVGALVATTLTAALAVPAAAQPTAHTPLAGAVGVRPRAAALRPAPPRIAADGPVLLTAAPRATLDQQPRRGDVRPAGAATRSLRAPMANTPFYGMETYTDDPAGVLGLYEYTLDGTSTLLYPLPLGSTVPSPVSGAVLADGKYTYQTYTTDALGNFATLYYVSVDLATGTTEVAELPPYYGAIVYAQAMDPTDGTVYAIGFDGTDLQFGTLDRETHMMQWMCPILTDYVPDFLSFASDGSCYALYSFEFGTLIFRFDTTSGEYDVMGSVEDFPVQYATSAAIDPATDLYTYHANTDAEQAFYTVDPTTGALTWRSAYTGSGSEVEILGLAYETVVTLTGDPSAVPAAVTGLTATDTPAGGGSVMLTVAYTAPTTMADGVTPLPADGQVQVRVAVKSSDGYAAEREATARVGARTTHALTLPAPGRYTVTVTPHSAAGNGPAASVTGWYGADVPGAPRALRVDADTEAQTFVLTWDAPVGQHGRPYDASKVTYRVDRIVDGARQPVAVALSDTMFADACRYDAYTRVGYAVTTLSNGTECGTTETERTWAVGAHPAPVRFGLSTRMEFDDFLTVDANGDANTWTYAPSYSAAQYYYNPDAITAADDWLITPAVAVEAGKYYRIEFDDWRQDAAYPERLEARAGYVRSADGMTEALVTAHTVSALSERREHHTALLKAERTGSLYVGLHAVSAADAYALYVSDIAVSAPIAGDVPAPVRHATATADATGALTCVLDFDAPHETLNGDALAEVGIRVTRGTSVVYDAAAAPGQHIALTVDAVHGINTFSVVAYTPTGVSEAVVLSVYAGIEKPSMPGEVRFEAIDGGHRIAWTPVVGGANGGSVGDVTYTVVRYLEGATQRQDAVSGLTEPTYDWIDTYDEQMFVRFGVQAVNSEGRSDILTTEGSDIVGTPYSLPFVEHFADPLTGEAAYQNGFWATGRNSEYSAWVFDTNFSSDGDGGSLVFYNPYGTMFVGFSMLYTGMIDVADAERLILKYDVAMAPEADAFDYIEVHVSTDRGQTWTTEPLDRHDATEYTTAAFRTFSVDLGAYAGGAPINVGFFVVDAAGMNIHLDNIRLSAPADYDIALTGLTAPARVEAPTAFEAVATLSNEGLQPIADGVTVALYDGTALLEERPLTEVLPAGAQTAVTFTVQAPTDGPDAFALRAVVYYEADATPYDHESKVVTTTVVKPVLPVVGDLAATVSADGTTALLTWSAPTAAGEPTLLTETFEDYEAFGLDGFGRWTVTDGDGGETFGVEVPFPNMRAPHAWMVFDSEQTNMWLPHGGAKMLLSMCPKTVVADDWLISPLLPGTAQTVTFYVSEVTKLYGNETYEVLYSTQSRNTGDFHIIGGTREVTSTVSAAYGTDPYEQVSVDLPEGARYFAIRHTSNNALGMFVDDVTFTALVGGSDARLMGYNVYRNAERLNDALLAEPTYTVALTEAEAAFTVTAVYDLGESAPSEGVTLSSGSMAIETVEADGTEVPVYDLYGRRVERAVEGQPVVRGGRAVLRK